MHEDSKKLMRGFIANFLNGNKALRILDVGAYDVNGNYRELFSQYCYTGMDVEPGPNVDLVVSKPYDWKEIEDESYDIVVSGQALEHIEFPWLTMTEISRVMTRGGLCCIVFPSKGPLHYYPLDCWRIMPQGAAALAKWVGLKVLDIRESHNEKWADIGLIAEKPIE